ncbi:MAG: PilW family protein [Methylococcaceae bacterium]|nr:PilW family protein [Methylococcaceae bacterium]
MKYLGLIDRQKGFTLIEIMIALLLGIFLTSGVIQIFLGSKQTYRMQENMSRIQENGRFAMYFLARDIRMSGYWGCVKNNDNVITNDIDIVDTDPDYNEDIHDYGNSVSGSNGTEHGSNSALDASDSLTLKGAFDSGIRLTTASSLVSTLSTLLTAVDSDLEGKFAIVSDCRAGDIFQVDTAANQDPGNTAADVSKIYGVDSRVFKLQTITYRIQIGAGGQPSLFKIDNEGAQELVEGIENMQILYGVDNDGNKTPDYYVPASGGLDFSKVISIRISLLARTYDDNVTKQALTYIYNGGTTSAPGDRRKRQVFSSTIALRNQLP